jgi:hypothetical protein
MITSELRAPAMETMDVLEGEDILVHHDGGRFRLMMGYLGMHCYVDPRGYYWVGIHESGFPEHDRWAFVLDAAQVAKKRSWVAADFYDVIGGKPDIRPQFPAFLDLPQILANVHDLIEEVVKRMDQNTADSKPDWVRRHDLRVRALQMWATLGIGSDTAAYEKLMRVPWGQDMHDLIHHTENWLERHPEFAGMPRELLLRMHGFDDTTLAWQETACVL